MPWAIWSNPARVRYGPLCPKSGNGGEDDARINGTQRFVGYSQAVFDVRPKILNHHVCVPDQSHENVVAGLFLQIERQRTLVAVKIQHV
jgi:hypothetical protein